MPRFSMQSILRNSTWLSVGFLLLLSYFTYVHNYAYPSDLFWDENYHVASAQKYLNGVFFMEPHPPLGKLFIALGEALVDANPVDNQFIGTDYATNPSDDFSFAGYRFFPVLFAWLTVLLVFGIFRLIVRKDLWALLLCFLYVFDNALIVHSRAAMLESTMLFFSALAVFAFLLLFEWKDNTKKFRFAAALFGASFACALATKAFALLFILLFPAALWLLWPRFRQFLTFLWIAAVAFAVFYCGIWQVHFALSSTIVPSLPDAGYYQASPEYKTILQNGKNGSIFAFPYMLRDSLDFVSHYQKGVPRLDLSKDDENGSPWFLWPFGGRTINYRWVTDGGGDYAYLYLVSNPVVWFAGLIGVLFSAALLIGSVLFPEGVRLRNRNGILVFFGLYASYMIAVSRIDRVMYLYHYFLPLFFSFILLAYVVVEKQYIGRFKLDENRKTSMLLALGVLIFLSFQFFRPLSYYEPMSNNEVQMRSWLRIWELRCVNCEKDSPFVVN
jgi:dolichyl-phosphate-mannose-protein mannosyltransferase